MLLAGRDGPAGLAAARKLAAAGREVVVLEARDRVGGRVWNREMQHRYRGLIPSFGLLHVAALGLGLWRLDRMVGRMPIDAPWTVRGAGKLDALTLSEWVGNPLNVPSGKARALLLTGLSTFFCVSPAEVSLLGSMVLAAGGGGFRYYADSKKTETHLVDGGSPEPAAVIKTIISYDEPFWRSDGLTGETVAPESAVPVSIDQSPRSGSPGVITSFAVGPKAIQLAGLSPEDRREAWLTELSTRLGRKARTPSAYLEPTGQPSHGPWAA